MAQAPEVPKTPIELLTNKFLIEEPYINKYWGPGLLGSLTFVGVCVANWFTRRPMMSGIQKHIGMTAAAIVIGKYLNDYRDEYLAERDAILRHYIELHPDDFPSFGRKKYADVFEPWIPIR